MTPFCIWAACADYLELCPDVVNGKTHCEYNTVSPREDHTCLKKREMGFLEKGQKKPHKNKPGNMIALYPLYCLWSAWRLPESLQLLEKMTGNENVFRKSNVFFTFMNKPSISFDTCKHYLLGSNHNISCFLLSFDLHENTLHKQAKKINVTNNQYYYFILYHFNLKDWQSQ